jgi:hypothetical protein
MTTPIPSNRFTVSRLPDGVSLVAEASDLDPICNSPIRNSLEVRSIKTGVIIRFSMVEIERDSEGDIVAWKFDPIPEDRARANGARVVILND